MDHNLNINMTTQQTINAIDQQVAILSLDGTILMTNQEWNDSLKKLDHAPCLANIETNYFDFLERTMNISLLSNVEKVISGELSQYSYTYPYHSSTKEQYFEMIVSVIKDNQHVQALMIRHIDATTMKDYQGYLSNILESMTDGIFTLNRNQKITFANKEAIRLLKVPTERILGKTVWQAFPSLLHTEFEAGYIQAISTNTTVKIEAYFEPQKTWYQVHYYPRKQGGLAVYFQSINKRKEIEDKLIYSAYYDELTGLPNRKSLQLEIQKSIDATGKNDNLTVFFIGVDSFKNISDLYGHNIGDELLKHLADRLKSITNENSSFVARFGGDQFVILCREKNTIQKSDQFSKQILQEIQKPFHILHHNEFTITASVGISIYPDDAITVGDLLSTADTAVFKAKEQSGNRVVYYQREMRETLAHRMTFLNLLKKALITDDIYFVFQPQVALSTGKITGIEVLTRWIDSQYSNISPAIFIPLAEESGLIKNITEKLIVKVFPLLESWLNQGFFTGSLAINFSTPLLESDSFINDFISSIKRFEFPPGTIEVELTESVQLLTSQHINSNLQLLRRNGVKIAIDDFGTGYSNFAYLSKFPLDKVKIDMTFIHHIGTNQRTEEILLVLIQLSQKLGYDCIAEGVETKEQLLFLAENKCELIQGYYYYRPMEQKQLTIELKKQLETKNTLL
ncbi:EAL domain-containing protein [Salipaludibacillus sp. HK11]|uniref:EAL domain-containing protein n=1 Tax=Salipaludibacillus sp. HK11 TaxID=3394320 RepID=UPI0039FD0FBD